MIKSRVTHEVKGDTVEYTISLYDEKDVVLDTITQTVMESTAGKDLTKFGKELSDRLSLQQEDSRRAGEKRVINTSLTNLEARIEQLETNLNDKLDNILKAIRE